MSTTTQPPTGTGNFFGLKQQADTAAKEYMDNVGRHDRRALPKEQESRDKMKEIQNRVNEHVRANSIFDNNELLLAFCSALLKKDLGERFGRTLIKMDYRTFITLVHTKLN